MKTTKKENPCRVSDRAYRTIISDVIDSMTGCKIDPFTFKQVVTAVRHYLTDGKITGLGKKAKQIFERRLPELDLAIRRSATARAAAARRRTAKNTAGAEAPEPVRTVEKINDAGESAPVHFNNAQETVTSSIIRATDSGVRASKSSRRMVTRYPAISTDAGLRSICPSPPVA